MTQNTASTPSDVLRRIYNKIDAVFDRGALEKEHRFTRSALTTHGSLTLGAVYALCQNIAGEFDDKPRLTLAAAPEGTDRNGAGRRWELFFYLPKRRAVLECAWIMPENEEEEARIEVTARPFPPEDSSLRTMVAQGKLLRRQLIGMWQAELHKHPELPRHFHNSDRALIKFVQQGLDPAAEEFSLTAKYVDGRQANWVLKTREKTYQIPFGLETEAVSG